MNRADQRIDWRKAMHHQNVFNVTLSVAKLPRLADILHKDEGDVIAELCFGLGDHGQLLVTGTIDTRLCFLCQRCLQAMYLDLSVPVALQGVLNEVQAQEVEEAFDPLLLPDETISMVDLVEDELLLHIPASPKHANCQAPSDDLAKKDFTKRENPFKILDQLKRR